MLRGAIVGIGKIAQTGHMPAFSDERIRGRAEIVAAVDTSIESRKIATQRFPRLWLYENIQQLFRKEQIDFVDICTPPHLHGKFIEAALRQRVHILCEKPFATSLKEAEHLSDSLRKEKELVFMLCHQYRYSLLWQQLKSFLHDAAAEDRAFLQFNVFRTEADPGLHTESRPWRTDRPVSGGGILADTGVHYLYLSLWMMGFPTNVTARNYQLVHTNNSVEDTAVVQLESPKGITQINLTWAADRRANSAQLVCKRGGMTYDGSNLIRSCNGIRETLTVPDASDKSHYVSLYVSLIDEFIQQIESGRRNAASIEEAHQSVKLLQACYTSAKSGKTMSVD